MPDPTHTFGTTGDPLGVATILANFDLMSVTTGITKGSAVHKGAAGEYVSTTQQAFNEVEQYTCEYEANIAGAAGAVAITIQNSAVDITNIGVRTSATGFARVTVTGHKHTGGTSAAHLTNARTVTLPAFNGYGATCLMASALTAADVQSSEWTASIDHTDRQNSTGNFLCGKSHGVKVTASTSAVTDSAAVADPSGWKLLGKDLAKVNEDFYSVTLRGEKFLDAPA